MLYNLQNTRVDNSGRLAIFDAAGAATSSLDGFDNPL